MLVLLRVASGQALLPCRLLPHPLPFLHPTPRPRSSAPAAAASGSVMKVLNVAEKMMRPRTWRASCPAAGPAWWAVRSQGLGLDVGWRMFLGKLVMSVRRGWGYEMFSMMSSAPSIHLELIYLCCLLLRQQTGIWRIFDGRGSPSSTLCLIHTFGLWDTGTSYIAFNLSMIYL